MVGGMVVPEVSPVLAPRAMEKGDMRVLSTSLR